MAVISTLLNNDLPQQQRSAPLLTKRLTLPATGVNNADNVQVYAFPAGSSGRITFAVLSVLATLGASATVQLQINRGGTRTSLTPATTAGAASKVESGSIVAVPFDFLGGDILELLVGGANVTASAGAVVDVEYTRN